METSSQQTYSLTKIINNYPITLETLAKGKSLGLIFP